MALVVVVLLAWALASSSEKRTTMRTRASVVDCVAGQASRLISSEPTDGYFAVDVGAGFVGAAVGDGKATGWHKSAVGSSYSLSSY